MVKVKHSVGRSRLLGLADFLETSVEAKRFDMKKWAKFKLDMNEAPKWSVIPIMSDRLDASILRGIRDVAKCGTAACALGWGTAMPRLRKAGLRIIDDRSQIGNIAIVRKNVGGGQTYLFGADEVCLDLFGIEREWTFALFAIDNTSIHMNTRVALPDLDPFPIPRTPKQAAKHIRKIVALMDQRGDFFEF